MKRTENDRKTRLDLEFESWDEFLIYGDHRSKSGYHDSRSNEKGGWNGTRTWEEALTLARSGWPEGLRRIREISDYPALRASHECEIQEEGFRHAPSGAWVDVGAYLSGDPDCMLEFCETPVPRPIVRMLINISASSFIDPGEIMQRGAAVAALIDNLERRGIRVDASICVCVENSRGASTTRSLWTVPLKKAQDHLDMDRLAFQLAHPSTLRRFWFAACEQENNESFLRYLGGRGYGSPRNCDADEHGDSVYLPIVDEGNRKDFKTPEASAKWVAKQVSGIMAKGTVPA